ncbi:MAG TPA: hypothetical protein VF690_01575 [Hymenobacter sp.]
MSAEQENYYQQQQHRLLALCDYVLTQDAAHLTTVQQIDAWLLDLAAPDIFDDGAAGNVLVRQRRSFGQVCAALGEQGFPTAGAMTTFHFQSAITFLNEKNRRD